MIKSSLIVFAKNPLFGKVKTRIARTVGNKEALLIYEKLLLQVQQLSQESEIYTHVYYSDFIDPNDGWPMPIDRHLQIQVPDLGHRMLHAINEIMEKGRKIIIIGSDCPTIKKDHIDNALEALDNVDVVVGPSTDGGFYLLGLRKIDEHVFDHIQWSSESVTQQLKSNLVKLNLSFAELEALTDIDEHADWLEYSQSNPVGDQAAS